MRNDISESTDEIKKKTHKKVEKGKDLSEERKEEVKDKVDEAKKSAKETKGDVEKKVEETKESAKEMKEDVSSKIEEVKEEEDLEEKWGEFKKELEEQKAKFEKESKKEGINPAEKFFNELVSKLKEGQVQVDEVISDYTKTQPVKSKPLVDVLETNTTITLIVDIPGVKKDDIDIGISKNRVEISAKFKKEPEIEDAEFIQKERIYGKANRTINLSTKINVKEAKAKYEECKLTITLPKVTEDITKVDIE